MSDADEPIENGGGAGEEDASDPDPYSAENVAKSRATSRATSRAAAAQDPDALKAELKKCRDRCAELEEALEALGVKQPTTEYSIDELLHKVKKMKYNMDKKDKEIVALRAEIDQLTLENGALKGQNDEAQVLEEMLKSARLETKVKVTEITKLKKQVTALQGSASAASTPRKSDGVPALETPRSGKKGGKEVKGDEPPNPAPEPAKADKKKKK